LDRLARVVEVPDDSVAMPRVLITGFCAVPGPRRAGVQLRHVIRSLTAFHSVDLLVVREGEQAYVERQGSVRVLRVPPHESDMKSQIQSFQRALKRQLDGADYDVVHCRDSWSGIPVLEARDRLGYAVVYDLTRSPLGEPLLDPELDAQYSRDEEACILAADLVLAPTPAAVKALQARGRTLPVMLSPPGVDVDRFDWDDAGKRDIPRILYSGSIDPGRGVLVLLRAMASIVRETDARLVLAGPMVSPKFEAALRDRIRELGLADKVEILGAVDHDQLPALIATASVCIVPAAADLTPNPGVVFPTKLLEYMACKRAVVAPRRETVTMVVENGREALLFEPGDPIDLARKVLRLLGEPALCNRIAEAGYERVRRDFTASAARRHLRNAYQVLIDRFGDQFVATPEEDAPKIEILADDDFEATVFEEAPQAPGVDTSLNRISSPEAIDAQLATGTTGSDVEIVPPPGDWVDTGVSRAVRALEEEAAAEAKIDAAVQSLEEEEEAERSERPLVRAESEDGTPVLGMPVVPPPPIVSTETPFVAGEIDVPTPPPEALDGKTPAIELTDAGKLR
jgi:glycosyltransferase involved in cell wall biosynthesis